MLKRVNFVVRITFAALFGFAVAQHYAGSYQEPLSSSERQKLDSLVEQFLKEPKRKQTPAPKVRKFDISISDGKFEELSKKWRDGIHWLLSTGKCRAYDRIVWNSLTGNKITKNLKYAVVKAQMMVESGCRWNVIGGGTDYGLFQVQKRACEDVGVEGDLLDPKTNTKCAIAYHKKLCVSYGKCALTERLVAYNVGPTGSSRVKNKRAHQYPRKIEYALRALLKRKTKFSGV